MQAEALEKESIGNIYEFKYTLLGRMISRSAKRKIVGDYELGRTLGKGKERTLFLSAALSAPVSRSLIYCPDVFLFLQGNFGKVKYAEHIQTGERFAIKILDKDKIARQSMVQHLKREISIMKLMNNPHVIKLREVLASKTNFYLVLELVTGGELFDEIVREKKFTEDKARFYFRQLVEGAEHCHMQGICHRDLKPENILLDEVSRSTSSVMLALKKS